MDNNEEKNDSLDKNKYDSNIAQDIEAANNLMQRVDEKLTVTVLILFILAMFGFLILR